MNPNCGTTNIPHFGRTNPNFVFLVNEISEGALPKKKALARLGVGWQRVH
jgi:hypothetical protein